jgi:hypothetical protein
MVEHLPSKHETMSSNPGIIKKKKKEKKRNEKKESLLRLATT